MDEELSKLVKIYAQSYQEWELACNHQGSVDLDHLRAKKSDLLQAQSTIMEYIHAHPEIRSLNLRNYVTYQYSASND